MDTTNRVLDELYFVTSTVVDWIDIFTRPKYKHIILESIAYCLLSSKKRIRKDGHPELIYLHDFYLQKLNYIHNNPVRQEIVSRPEEYLYSSARNYAGEKGLLEVIVTWVLYAVLQRITNPDTC